MEPGDLYQSLNFSGVLYLLLEQASEIYWWRCVRTESGRAILYHVPQTYLEESCVLVVK
jgi:hypothetical protein